MKLHQLIATQEKRVKNLKNSFRMAKGKAKHIESIKLNYARNTLSELKLLDIPCVSNRLTKKDLETIKEHRDLMNDVVTGDYKPDKFTNQPINKLINRLENGC